MEEEEAKEEVTLDLKRGSSWGSPYPAVLV